MALNSAIVWEIRTTGSDNNGGGFKTGASGTDYSQQASAQKSSTDLAVHSSTNTMVKPNAAGVSANDVGNVVQITAGTGWTAGFYEIVSQDGTWWTLDRSPSAAGNANLATYAMGGCLLSPGKIGGIVLTGHIVYLAYGSYTISSATYNVAAGCVQTTAGRAIFVGYDSTRTVYNTDSNRPTFTMGVGVTSTSAFHGYNYSHFRNIIVDCASRTSSNGFQGGALFTRCKVINTANAGFYTGTAYGCEVTSSGGAGAFYNNWCYRCSAHGNSCHSYESSYSYECVAYGNTNIGFYEGIAINCVAYGNTGANVHGFVRQNYDGYWINCISVGNGGYGFQNQYTNHWAGMMVNCFTYNNTSGGIYQSAWEAGNVTGSADPFTNAASQDFSLNNTAGGGAACRNAGIQSFSTDLNASMLSYVDIGMARHQDAGGAGGGSAVWA